MKIPSNKNLKKKKVTTKTELAVIGKKLEFLLLT